MLTASWFNKPKYRSNITIDLIQKADEAFSQNDRMKCLLAIECLYKTIDYETECLQVYARLQGLLN